MATLKERDFFGELALLNDQPAAPPSSPKIRSSLYVLNKEDFLATTRTSEPFDKQLRKRSSRGSRRNAEVGRMNDE